MFNIESFSAKAIKSTLILFNLLFVVTGLILLLTGILIKGFFREYEPFLDDKYFSASSLLIASGTIIFVIAFFGCYGAMRENRCMILTYSFFLVLLIVLEFSSGITAYVLTGETSEVVNQKLNQSMYQYTKSREISVLWDEVQSELRCCGLNSYKDWNVVFGNSSLPVSCCTPVPGTLDNFTCNSTSEFLYKSSCTDKLSNEIEQHTRALGGFAFGIIGVQLLGIFFSCFLIKAIKNSNYETV